MDSRNDVQSPPPVAVAKDIDWEATTAEYASLLGMSRRSPEQEDRYCRLSEIMSRRPPPWMTPVEQEEYFASLERTEQALLLAVRRHATSGI